MKKHLFSTFSLSASMIVLSACSFSNTDDVCEDVTIATEQIQACQSLHRKIVRAKNEPLIRTELERRYQQDCIDIRYYRDEHQTAICGNKESMQEIEKEDMEGKPLN